VTRLNLGKIAIFKKNNYLSKNLIAKYLCFGKKYEEKEFTVKLGYNELYGTISICSL